MEKAVLTASDQARAAGSPVDPAQLQRWRKRRWIVWGALAFAMLVVILDRFSLGAAADRVMADLGMTAAALGTLAAAYYYIYAGLQIPAGILTDRFGSRRMAAGGVAIGALGSFLFAAAPGMPVAYLGRFLVGLGVATVFTALAKAQAEWFRAGEYATMTGLMAAIATTGALLGATPFAALVNLVGWRGAYTTIGAAFVVATVVVWRVVADRPAQDGLPSPREIDAAERGDPVVATPTGAAGRPDLVAGLRRIVRQREIWPPFVAMLGLYGPYVAMTSVFGIPYLMQTYDLSRPQAATFPALAAFGMMIGGPLAGFFSDKVMHSRRLPLLLMTGLGTATWLPMVLWDGGHPPIGFLIVFYFLLGLSNSIFILGLTVAKELNPPSIAGVASGFMNVSSFAGAALFQPVAGYLLDLGWAGGLADGARIYPVAAYQLTFIAGFLICAVALIGAILTPETFPGRGK